MASSSNVVADEPSLPSLTFTTLIHMITIKLSSSNYLLWKAQLVPLLSSQNLMGYVTGTVTMSSPTLLDTAGKSIPNPKYVDWSATDQCLLSLLLSTLTKETMPEVLGCSSSRAVWTALEMAFSNRSKSQEIRLKDELQLMKKGTRSISEFGRHFKLLCDQLAAIGRPVDDTDKSHWFLRGLGPAFSSFSAAQLSLSPVPSFRDLLSKAESFDLFQQSLDNSASTQTAFSATSGRDSSRSGQGRGILGPAPNNGGRGRGNSGNWGRGNNNSSNSGNQGRHPPRCQICKEDDHFADRCSKRFDQSYISNTSSLATIFNAACQIQPNSSDWFLDSGASSHMTSSSSNLDSSQPYTEPAQQGHPGQRST